MEINHYLQTLLLLNDGRFSYKLLDQANGVFYHLYKPQVTAEMLDEEYKEELMEVNRFCNDHKVRNMISDNREFMFPITPELQEWTNEHIFAKAPYIDRCGLIMSSDFIGQLSIEQAVEEQKNGDFVIRFFASIPEAEAWVLGK